MMRMIAILAIYVYICVIFKLVCIIYCIYRKKESHISQIPIYSIRLQEEQTMKELILN